MKEMQKRRFDKYYAKYGEFVVARHVHEKGAWLYFNYNSPEYKMRFEDNEYYPNHRYIFPDEIVIDIDCKDDEYYEVICDAIVNKLHHLDVSYSLWDTGSDKGFHIHLFVDKLNQLNTLDRITAKRKIIQFIVPEAFWKHIDFQLCNKHLIRAEFGLYEKNPMKESFKTLVEKRVVPNQISIFDGIIEDVLENKQLPTKGVNKASFIQNDLKCIKFLLSEDFISLKNGRDRAMFIIGTYYLNHGKDEDETFILLQKYNKYNLNHKFTDLQIWSKIKCWKKEGYSPKCRFTKVLMEELKQEEICSSCPYNKF